MTPRRTIGDPVVRGVHPDPSACRVGRDGKRFQHACANVAPGQGNNIVSVDDPAGEWSDALWIASDAFDPSLTFDADTVCYTRRSIVHDRARCGYVSDIGTNTYACCAPRRTRPIRTRFGMFSTGAAARVHDVRRTTGGKLQA